MLSSTVVRGRGSGIWNEEGRPHLSAIVTISRLHAWDKLNRDWEYLVARGTFDRITEWLHSTEGGSQPAGYSFLGDDGKIGFQPVTSEQLENERNEIQSIVAEVALYVL